MYSYILVISNEHISQNSFLKKSRYHSTQPNDLLVEKKSLKGQLTLLSSVVENFIPRQV